MNENILFLVSDTRYFVNERIKSICKNFEELDIYKYDLTEVPFEQVLIDCNTNSLFSDKKLMICRNFDLSKLSKNDEKDFTKYLEKQNNDVMLIVVSTKSLDKRKKITKLIKENTDYKEFNDFSLDDLTKRVVVKLQKNNLSIDQDALKTFMNRTEGNIDLIINELNKLILYKDKGEFISLNDVETLVTYDVNKKIYDLSMLVLKRDRERAINLYKELRLYNDEIGLISLLANNFRMINLVQIFSKYHLDDNTLAKLIGLGNPRRLYYLKKESAMPVKKTLYDLANLDYRIKTGQIDKRIGFELFILGL